MQAITINKWNWQ